MVNQVLDIKFNFLGRSALGFDPTIKSYFELDVNEVR